MKTIGLLGGMSWESTMEYYKLINEEVRNKLGQLHSAKIILNSVDFEPIEKLQHFGRWDELSNILVDEAKKIEAAKADFLLICTNTMHKVAKQIKQETNIPLIHIADATAEVLIGEGVKKVGLLGTKFTMEEDFYKGRLKKRYGVDVLIPSCEERTVVHNIIYQELCLGKIKNSSKQKYLDIIDNLVSQGAEGIILGCTEIGLLLEQKDCDIKLYDTTKIHAKKAVKVAIDG